MPDHPHLLFVAGPNGSGKSTFSKALSQPGAVIFDVDKIITIIEQRFPTMSKKQVYQEATQEFYDQASTAVDKRQHFTLETNFRDEPLVDIVANFKRNGYTTNMVYLTLDSIELSASRVTERVSNGGHYVDLKNIQLNYKIGLQYLEHFGDAFDNLDIVDASKDPKTLRSLLKIENQKLVYLSNSLPHNVEQTIINIADRYQNNRRDHYLGR